MRTRTTKRHCHRDCAPCTNDCFVHIAKRLCHRHGYAVRCTKLLRCTYRFFEFYSLFLEHHRMSFKRFEIPPRFHDLPMGMRRASLCADLTSENVLKTLLGRHDLDDKAYDFIDKSIDAMIENAIGTHPMPLGVVPNFCVDGTMHAVAMATEEPSVIAGFNRVSRVFNASGGTLTSMPMPMTAAQIAIAISPQNASHLLENLQSRVDDWRMPIPPSSPLAVESFKSILR